MPTMFEISDQLHVKQKEQLQMRDQAITLT